MSMKVIIPDSKGTTYEPIPADNHVGICIGVIDLGTHRESYQGGPEKNVKKIKLQFEIPAVKREDGGTGIIDAKFNLSFHEKATFRKTLDLWLGKDWVDKYRGERLDFLISLPAMVNVEQGPSSKDPSRTVAWVASLSKLPKGMPVPEMTRDIFWLDLDEKFLPTTLSTWDADLIRRSLEYQAGGFTDEAPRYEGTVASPATPRPPGPPSSAYKPGIVAEAVATGEVPF